VWYDPPGVRPQGCLRQRCCCLSDLVGGAALSRRDDWPRAASLPWDMEQHPHLGPNETVGGSAEASRLRGARVGHLPGLLHHSDRGARGFGQVAPAAPDRLSERSMELRSRIPSGAIESKWDNQRFEMKLVNPANKRKY